MLYKVYIDGVYRSKWVAKFINQCGFAGKKQVSEYLIFLVFFYIKKKLQVAPLFFFFEVIEKIKPVIGLRLYNKNSAGAPYLLAVHCRYKKAIFWLARAIKLRVGNAFFVKIFQEFYDILFLNSGLSYKKKRGHYAYSILYKKNYRFKW